MKLQLFPSAFELRAELSKSYCLCSMLMRKAGASSHQVLKTFIFFTVAFMFVSFFYVKENILTILTVALQHVTSHKESSKISLVFFLFFLQDFSSNTDFFFGGVEVDFFMVIFLSICHRILWLHFVCNSKHVLVVKIIGESFLLKT